MWDCKDYYDCNVSITILCIFPNHSSLREMIFNRMEEDATVQQFTSQTGIDFRLMLKILF